MISRFLIYLFTILFLTSWLNVQAQSRNAAFDLRALPAGEVIGLIYSEVLKTNYLLDPAVLLDTRLVSFRYSQADGPLKPFVKKFLNSLGYAVDDSSLFDTVSLMKPAALPGADFTRVYRPKHRDAGYLTKLLTPLLKGRFIANRAVEMPPGAAVAMNVPSTSAAGQQDQDADIIIFQGTEKEIKLLDGLLAEVDVRPDQIHVKGVIYEVSSSQRDGSAFQLLANLLSGKLGITLNADAPTLPNSVRISIGGIDALIGAISTDSRFKVLTQPRLTVRSGQTSNLVVGQDVPVLGSVSYQPGGNAVQAVTYQPSGTILTLSPVVHRSSIDLQVKQQLSNFVMTSTGVNNSPTLIKRSLDTSVTASSGDVLILGGLTQTKDTKSKSGFFTNRFSTEQQDNEVIDLLVLLQVDAELQK